jgi:hypothetical protein
MPKTSPIGHVSGAPVELKNPAGNCGRWGVERVLGGRAFSRSWRLVGFTVLAFKTAAAAGIMHLSTMVQPRRSAAAKSSPTWLLM